MKKFAAFDIDGTLYRSGLFREVIFELIRMEAVPDDVYTAYAPLERQWKRRASNNAFREFDRTITRAFDSNLAKIRFSDFDTAAERVIAQHAENVYAYTRDLAHRLKNEGYFMIAISGSQGELVGPFVERYGFDVWIAQHYERGAEYFTGNAIKTHKGKDTFLRQLIEAHDLQLEGSIAVGDSAGDIEMLAMVEHAIAFNPEQKLFDHAQANTWDIVVERKNMVYTLRHDGQRYILAETNR